MKVKKKYLIIVLILILLLLGVLVVHYFKDKKILCTLDKDKMKIVYNISLKNGINNINVKYLYKFDTMDETVDKYDEINEYLNFINKRKGIKTDINQEDHNLTYHISIDLSKVDKKNYDLLNISEVVKLKNKKEIKEYYEKLGYTCK